MSERRPTETNIPADELDPGMRETDDHVAGDPTAAGHQPTADLDRGVATEHLSSPSQGARPDEPIGGAPGSGEQATGGGPSGGDGEPDSGPMFED
jgi:hypothetical protein